MKAHLVVSYSSLRGSSSGLRQVKKPLCPVEVPFFKLSWDWSLSGRIHLHATISFLLKVACGGFLFLLYFLSITFNCEIQCFRASKVQHFLPCDMFVCSKKKPKKNPRRIQIPLTRGSQWPSRKFKINTTRQSEMLMAKLEKLAEKISLVNSEERLMFTTCNRGDRFSYPLLTTWVNGENRLKTWPWSIFIGQINVAKLEYTHWQAMKTLWFFFCVCVF